MKYLEAFNRMMRESEAVALATAAKGEANVRIVNFCYDEAQKGVIYFSTFNDNKKIEEFEENSKVAFTTIPCGGIEHIRVKEGSVKQSQLSIYDVKERFVKKIPDYEETIEQAGEYLVLFEIHFGEAQVTIDFEQSGTITF